MANVQIVALNNILRSSPSCFIRILKFLHSKSYTQDSVWILAVLVPSDCLCFLAVATYSFECIHLSDVSNERATANRVPLHPRDNAQDR